MLEKRFYGERVRRYTDKMAHVLYDAYLRMDKERDAQKRRLGERAPIDRMITAAEVANAVLFLASDESSGFQAAEIVVDGGTTGALAGSPRYIRGEP